MTARRAKRTPRAPEPPVDRGADGLANRLRPFGIVWRDRSFRYDGYQDAHLIDRMHACNQINELQHRVAQRVLELHADAGFEPSVTSNYSPLSNRGHDDDTEESGAITRFRRLLGSCSQAAALQLHGMCLEQHPGTARLGSLQAALDDLAKQWGMT